MALRLPTASSWSGCDLRRQGCGIMQAAWWRSEIGMLVDRHVVRQAVRALGLGQQPLCVHASFRSFGGVSGGPAAVVDGLLDEGCTVLVPTFSWGYEVPPPPGLRPARNA